MEDEAESLGGDDAGAAEVGIEKRKRSKAAATVLYAPLSQGARKQDEEMQKKLETTDERRLASIVSGLGSFEPSDGEEWHRRAEVFVKGSQCLERMRELQRCVARDNPDKRRVFMQLGQWNIVGKYLVPIIQRYSEDNQLFLASLKVAILLTLPIDRNSTNTFDQVEYLCQIKEEFREGNVLAAIIAHLEEPLENLEKGCFSDDDRKLLQLVLAFIQNLLAVPETMNWVGPYPAERYSRLRDGLLECLFRECGPDIVLAITKHLPAFKTGIRKDNLLILQILHHMFWGQKPDLLFQSSEKTRTNSTASNDIRRKKLHRYTHLSGAFVRVDKDGSRKMVAAGPFETADPKCPRIDEPKGKSAAPEINIPLPSRDGVSVLLKDYADQVLETGAFDILMQTVQEDIRKERREIEICDFIAFFELAEFFLSFHRYKLLKTLASPKDDNSTSNSVCGHISCTMTAEALTMVVSKWHEYIDLAKTPVDWIPVVAAGSLLREMIYILDVVLKNRSDVSSRDVRTARTLTYKVFYDQTESGILSTCSKSIEAFNSSKQPRRHLQNAVEVTHVTLKLIESITKEDGDLIVAQKSRKRPTKKQTEPDKAEDLPEEHMPEHLEASDRSQMEQIEKDQQQTQMQQPALDDLPDEQNEGSTRESKLNISRCLRRFADDTSVSNYCWLLSFYQSNSPALNYYIVCMLLRLCEHCKVESMLYQISTLEIFESIISDKELRRQEEHKFLVPFAKKIVRNFFKKLQSNPLLYMDALFPKDYELCRLIDDDYPAYKLKASAGNINANLADALDEDDETSFDNLALDSTSIIGERGVAHRTVAKRKKGPFSEEDEKRIIELFEQFKDKRSCSKLIAEALDQDGKFSAAQVARKLKHLGLHRNKKASSKSNSDENINNDENIDRNNDNDDERDLANDDGESDYEQDYAENGIFSDNEEETTVPSGENQNAIVVHPGHLENTDAEMAELSSGNNQIETVEHPLSRNKRLVKHQAAADQGSEDLMNSEEANAAETTLPSGDDQTESINQPVRRKRLVKHQAADEISQNMLELEDLAAASDVEVPVRAAKRRAFTIADDDDDD